VRNAEFRVKIKNIKAISLQRHRSVEFRVRNAEFRVKIKNIKAISPQSHGERGVLEKIWSACSRNYFLWKSIILPWLFLLPFMFLTLLSK